MLCLFPKGSTTRNRSREGRIRKPMYIFQPSFFYRNLHSSNKQWTDFPQRNVSYQTAKPSQTMCLRVFHLHIPPLFFWLQGHTVFISLLCHAIYFCLFYHCGSVTAFALPYPGTLRMSQVPISIFFLFFPTFFFLPDAPHIIPTHPCLLPHGWSHGGFDSKYSIAMEYQFK